MAYTIRFSLLALVTLAFGELTSVAFAADPNGTWLTEPGTSRIHIASCGGALCGSIVWLKEPNDFRHSSTAPR